MSQPITGNPFEGLNPKSIDHLAQAAAISEWYLLKNDLQASFKTAHVLSQKAPESLSSEEDRLTCESLCRDMIVQFIACFQRSKNCSLVPSEIYASWPDGLAHFRYVESLRNGYAAHRHGPQRQCVVAVYMDSDVPHSIGPVFVTFHIPGRDEIFKLMKLIEIALETVQSRIDTLGMGVFEALQNITPAEFATFEEPSWDQPMAEQFDMTRREFKAFVKNPSQRPQRSRSGRARHRP